MASRRRNFGKVVPYGVYDVTANAGFVSVGITSDTAEFAVQSIRCWRDGTAALSPCARADDHGRLWRLERGAGAAVEGLSWTPDLGPLFKV